MKKIAIFAASAALFFSAVLPAFAKVDRVPGPWEITAPNPIVFSCGGGNYNHTLNTVSNDLSTSSFTGTGSYDANSSYTWNINGNINNDAITFTIVYTGSNPGYTLNGTGTIASNGSISGTTDGNCQSFSMPVGTAVLTFTGNHGQYVRSQENKQEAAQSRVGMPGQSKGNTK